jgi:hypothetical protein
MRMKTPTELDPAIGRDEVPPAFPIGPILLDAVTIPPCLNPQVIRIAHLY